MLALHFGADTADYARADFRIPRQFGDHVADERLTLARIAGRR
jgi:hypothetical protein